MPLSPSERSLHARDAAYTRWANEDPVEGTAKARQTFLAKFIDEVDPDRILPEPERLRRAEAAKKAHFTRMALRSAQARRKRAS
jgi:hypothetical protein